MLPVLALTFALGMRHGLDADHLATIDGLTRFNAGAGRLRLARCCGLLFSLGHGGVVLAVAVLAALAVGSSRLPDWFDALGSWFSTLFLLLLGGLNLHAVLTTPAGATVRLVGVKGRWLGGLALAGHPLLVALVGALFALSFDTLSQALLFSAATAQQGAWALAVLSALAFMLGMIATDAANGLWLARLLRRADARAAAASRVMGLAVALLSLAVAALGLLHQLVPAWAAWQEGRELALGVAVLLAVALAFAWACRAASRAVA
ncbi:MAG: nickel transporter [Pseudomonadota bacterium]|nr:nickel transporter [Pseudomonadota bacterium]